MTRTDTKRKRWVEDRGVQRSWMRDIQEREDKGNWQDDGDGHQEEEMDGGLQRTCMKG